MIGNPENRRVTGFVDALRADGQAPLAVVAWRDVLADPRVLLAVPDVPAWLRLDSTGEDDAVQRGLYLRGGGDPGVTLRFGQLHAVSTHQAGFVRLLDELEQVLTERPRWRPIAPFPSIVRAFDKAAFHARCTSLGVQVAPALQVTSYDGLVDAMIRTGSDPKRRAFVKLRYGSSATGIGVYSHVPAPRLHTTVRVTPDGWFNTLQMCRLTDVGRIRAVVDGLCADGAHVELEVPKAGIEGAFFDLRVVMIACEPAFVVVRCSHQPITNLHLGGWRGDLAAVRARCPPDVWDAAMADCRAVARDYGGLHVGLDVLIRRGWGGHAVIEANAFGDLLPNLVDADGRSVYARQIATVDAWGHETSAHRAQPS